MSGHYPGSEKMRGNVGGKKRNLTKREFLDGMEEKLDPQQEFDQMFQRLKSMKKQNTHGSGMEIDEETIKRHEERLSELGRSLSRRK